MPDDDDNLWISWGRCFFDNSGNEAPSRYIPCGNANFGHVSCCESGDMCLSSGACYNGEHGITYLAGCTDQAYKHDTCPAKGPYSDDAWIGLAYCNGTSNEWIACEANRGTNTVMKAKPCYCPRTSRTVAIHDASLLGNIVSLGTATGESVTWMGGHIPDPSTLTPTSLTVSGPAGAPSQSQTDNSAAATTASETGPAITSSTPSSGEDQSDGSSLGPGAKAGIGVGAGAASIALAATLFTLVRRYKHRQNLDENNDAQPPIAQPVTLYNDSDIHHGDLRSPAWSGHKSELDAVGTASPSPRYGDFDSAKSEVEGSPAIGSMGRPLTNGGYEMAGKKGPVYEMPA